MISLVRPNGHAILVNPDLMETAERDGESGVTVVLLTTGNTLIVSDDADTIVEKVAAFRRRCAS